MLWWLEGEVWSGIGGRRCGLVALEVLGTRVD